MNDAGSTGRPSLYLCAGMHSSGSSLISWCFLQRADMDGIFDWPATLLPILPEGVRSPKLWCKTKISCFRFGEMMDYCRDEGWEVHPLLVARDVRAVTQSLASKRYGRNGTTAEEPPLRIRLRRFRESWEQFRDHNWPVIRYESIVAQPETTLRATCEAMGLAWDPAMLSWPKQPEQIAVGWSSKDVVFRIAAPGNATFHETRHGGLLDTARPELSGVKTDRIPPADLEWMEREFEEFNRSLDYPAHVPSTWTGSPGERSRPRFEITHYYRRRRRLAPVMYLVSLMPSVVQEWIKRKW